MRLGGCRVWDRRLQIHRSCPFFAVFLPHIWIWGLQNRQNLSKLGSIFATTPQIRQPPRIALATARDRGCGNARNAAFLARDGFLVDAVDYAETAIDWAKERVAAAGVTVKFLCQSVFDLHAPLKPGRCRWL